MWRHGCCKKKVFCCLASCEPTHGFYCITLCSIKVHGWRMFLLLPISFVYSQIVLLSFHLRLLLLEGVVIFCYQGVVIFSYYSNLQQVVIRFELLHLLGNTSISPLRICYINYIAWKKFVNLLETNLKLVKPNRKDVIIFIRCIQAFLLYQSVIETI